MLANFRVGCIVFEFNLHSFVKVMERIDLSEKFHGLFRLVMLLNSSYHLKGRAP